MKAFVFSDLHASKSVFYKIKEYFKKEKRIGLVLFAGDLVNAGAPVSFAEEFRDWISEIKKPFLWVPGNNDFGESYEALNSVYPSLEGRAVRIGGRKFCGVGGSPASWSGAYQGAQSVLEKEICDSIFITHYPPPRLINLEKSDSLSPASGQKSGRNYADSPLVHIFGHLHTGFGTAYLGKTKIIKPGAAVFGRYAIMDLETLEVKFLSDKQKEKEN